MEKSIPDNVINPFSDAFLPTWDLWKAFRWDEHKFKYKGVISEQMALKRLVTLTEGDEIKAIRIVEQSISRGWMDFYELKQPSPKNGKSAAKPKQPTPKTGETTADRINAVQSEIVNRYSGGKEGDGSTHLKAV